MLKLKKIVMLVQTKNVNLVIQKSLNFVVHAMMDIIYLKKIKQNVHHARLKNVKYVLKIIAFIAWMMIKK